MVDEHAKGWRSGVSGDYIIHFTTLFTLYNNYAHSYIYE